MAVVQWIERRPPKSQIQVRFLAAAPRESYEHQFQNLDLQDRALSQVPRRTGLQENPDQEVTKALSSKG